MSEKIKISVVMDDGKPNVPQKENNEHVLVLTQQANVTIMSVLLQNRLMKDSFCSGRGDCGRCVIQFLEGAPLPTGLERARLAPEELRQGYRLACVAKPKRDCAVRIPDREGFDVPIVTEVNLPSEIIDQSSRKNNLPGNQKTADIKCQNRKSDGLLESGCYVIAVDLGTTTIAMQLCDMETGEAVDTYCEQNPQRRYGADVLSRIEASCSGSGEELRKLVCEALGRGMRQFRVYLQTKQSGVDAGRRKAPFSENGEENAQILCMCIAGNTTMQHLLLGYDVEGLGKAPFVPAETGLQKIFLSRLFPDGQRYDGDFPVYVAPCISAFVGGDIVAGLYALGMLSEFLRQENSQNGEAALLIDLGTNGEMAITDGRRMIVTATAAGPAFEGRGELIGTDRIAITADLLRQGIVDETGLMAEPYFEKGVRLESSGKRKAEGTRGGNSEEGKGKNEYYFKKEDVRALQMAKAAVRAGVEILWEEMGRPEIGQVYLAGGFGYYLDVEAAFAIGLLPSSMRGRVRAVGNTSLAGAYELGCALCAGGVDGAAPDGAVSVGAALDAEALETALSAVESVNLAEKRAFEGLYLKYMNLEEN